MNLETVDKQSASYRRTYPKPTLWAKGITRRDRLFLWWLAYRAHLENLSLADFYDHPQEACRKCRYPFERLEALWRDYPEAWQRMLEKRACHLRRTKDPRRPNDSQSTYWRVWKARQTNIKCRHPRLALKRGLQYHGKPLRERGADFRGEPTRARAREAELSHEASQPQVIQPQKEVERSEIAESDDRMAIRLNEHRRAEEAILAAIEKGVPLSLACWHAGVSYEVFLQWRKDNPEFESAVGRACQRRVFQSVKSTGPSRL
jgi:hypothetical protein